MLAAQCRAELVREVNSAHELATVFHSKAIFVPDGTPVEPVEPTREDVCKPAARLFRDAAKPRRQVNQLFR